MRRMAEEATAHNSMMGGDGNPARRSQADAQQAEGRPDTPRPAAAAAAGAGLPD
jgi:hypothetical protein